MGSWWRAIAFTTANYSSSAKTVASPEELTAREICPNVAGGN